MWTPPAAMRRSCGRRIAAALKLEGDQVKQCVKMMGQLYKAFTEKDMSLLEINPLVITKDGQLVCLDAKMNFDDNALDRHPDIKDLPRFERGRSQGNRGLEI